MNFELDLNKNQHEAVTADDQYLRIVAGAGSGKTRVLTYRIAYLIDNFHYRPHSILAFTFTNKVAAEMKERVMKLLPDLDEGLMIKTFHSFAAYFLRHEIAVLDFPQNFTILDDEDQTTLLKDICAHRGYKKKDPIVGEVKSFIAKQKLKEVTPDDVVVKKPDDKELKEIYQIYEDEKDKMKVLDFDDLLLKTNYILASYPSIREKWRRRYRSILIDEFQDTNDVEYKMVRFLLNDDTELYVVGDPDQTIYTWRGANQNIILNLKDFFPNIKTVILDRNYRSTNVILDSANKLIENNKDRIKKILYTEKAGGNPITVYRGISSANEAQYVAREIKRLIAQEHYEYSDIAILYRSNYVSREFEKALMSQGISYVIYGSTKFFERREVKDVLAYFHLLVNQLDDISFKRICNVPRRGLGETALNTLYNEAEESGLSLYNYVKEMDPEKTELPVRSMNSLKAMVQLLEITRENLSKNDEVYSKTLEDMIISLGYYEYLDKDDDGDDRKENVKSLFEDIRHFSKENPDSTFEEYLQSVTLNSAQDDVDDGNHVLLMTVHVAKGLEFPVVFVGAFNEGVFPSNHSLMDRGYEALEEERRLAYVAFTRAKKLLYITLASDYSFVLGGGLTPSRFLKESGNDKSSSTPVINPYIGQNPRPRVDPFKKLFNDGDHIDPYANTIYANVDEQKENKQSVNWKIGDIVLHDRLGKGKVIALEGDDIIKVDFEEHGIKSILSTHSMVKKGN